jgi:CheY-like chemotaxis protein
MEQALILVVEDDFGTRHVLERLLRRAGFEVRLAASDASALEMLRTIKPDLIVADLIMPERGEVSLIQQLKRQQEFANIPIIALSDHSYSLKAAAKSAGAQVVLRKPKDIPILAETVAQLLAEREQ